MSSFESEQDVPIEIYSYENPDSFSDPYLLDPDSDSDSDSGHEHGYRPKKDKIIMSIDIGLENLAIVLYDTRKKEFIECYLFDIRSMTLQCPYNSCPLFHTKTFSDYVSHLIYYNKETFDKCYLILIEQQPPGFGQIIEQLIFKEFRTKSILRSPSSMHCHFYISDFTYDIRKIKTTEIAYKHLEHLKNFQDVPIKNHMADATCFIIHYLYEKRIKKIKYETDLKIKENNKNFLDNGGRSFIKNIGKYKYIN